MTSQYRFSTANKKGIMTFYHNPFDFLVEMKRFELSTPALRRQCSPS